MSSQKHESRIRVFWQFVARFALGQMLISWLSEDVHGNAYKLTVTINGLSILLFFATALVSPWIFLVLVTLYYFLLGMGPVKGIFFFLNQTREDLHGLRWFMMTVIFYMLHWTAIFACLYMGLGVVHDAGNQPIEGVWKHYYFSIVTFTTLGYGNLVPANLFAEVVAAIEALFGFAILAWLIGVGSALAMRSRSPD